MTRPVALFLIAVGILLDTVGVLLIVLGAVNGPPEAIAGGVVLTVLGAVAMVFSVHGLSRTAPAPAPASADREGAYRVGTPEERSVGGERYEVFFRRAGHKNNPPAALFVQVPAAGPATIDFTREGWFDRLGKRLGIAAEVQTGDAEFDDAVYVRTASDAFAAEYLAEPARRAAVLALKAAGFTAVRLTKTHAQAEWTNFDPGKQDRPGLADEAGAAVLLLAAGVPADPDAAAPPNTRLGRLVGLWLFAVGWAALVICCFLFPPVRNMDLTAPAVGVAVGVYVAFAWLAAVLLRGTSTSHDKWGLLVLVGLLFVPLGGFGAVAGLNGLTDDGPPAVKSQVVQGKRVSTGKRNSKTYYVAVPDWSQPGVTVEFKVSQWEYDQAVQGKSRMELTVRPGALGIEWLAGKRFVP